MSSPQRMTIRTLGYTPGTLPPGPSNSILDVPGVHVSQSTVPTSSAANVTATKGLTIISPRHPHEFHKPCAAGTFTFNGNGCLTGTSQIEDWGFTNTPIAFTNSLSLGTVFDGMWDWVLDRQDAMNWDGLTKARHYGTPVVGETADWIINSDVRASRLEKGDIKSAFEGLKSSQNGGAVREGQEGGGAGMTCHMFTGGTGTSSRVLGAGIGNKEKEYTVGVLCQSNYGHTTDLIIGGVPVGKLLEKELAAQAQNKPDDGAEFHAPPPPPDSSPGRTKDGSILVLIITDAPFATHQLKRLARHATVGLASVGGHGIGRTFSGDIFLALSTAEDGPQQLGIRGGGQYQHTEIYQRSVVKNESIDAYFYAVAEATEEAVLNSLVGGREGTVGVSGERVEGLDVESVRGILEKHLVKFIMKYKEWKTLWHTCGGPTRDDLWTKYSHNRHAYNAAYFREETTINSNLERGMAAFAQWEMRLTRQIWSQEQRLAGQAAAGAFVKALAAGEMCANADFVFVSNDFEGALGNRAGITESGIAKMDTRDIVCNALDASSSASAISGHNYLLAKCRKQRCMFGDTTRIDKPQLAATIKAELNIPDGQLKAQRRIVLVGHGLHNEQLILERHGIKLGDMDAVIGILDPSQYGMGGSLETLLRRLSLPLPRNRNGMADSLHCAGNDAHFTLRALLALLYLQHQEGTGRGGDVEILDRLARAPLPLRLARNRLEDEEEEEDLTYDLFVESGFFEEWVYCSDGQCPLSV
ncbi:hypothetical protein LTR56_001374 [Elasticomyces elasticus]|nr:hypothetical protein LTR56_001374 [Elasticomyces elasticus]KAK3667555.1 hypothetical protein LTR22_001733 [Elasticomyces elasticus]KAK4927964.1 hypothetical protein LTR49_005163 [Elasticomyces elasticus]KAK5762401.1 hypothetical protein LTS12_007378 [Elasticomyces elasticus]